MTNGEGEMGKEKDDEMRNDKCQMRNGKGQMGKEEGERQKEKKRLPAWNDQSGKSLSYCC